MKMETNVRKIDESEPENVSNVKKIKTDDTDADLLEFLSWCESSGVIIDKEKVKITKMGTYHNYGMVAIKDLEADEVLTRIAKSSVLEPNTTKIKELIEKNSDNLKSDSNWSRLILSVMYEANNPESKWKSYLHLFPNYDLLDMPMFWDKDNFDKLESTCIHKNVKIDIVNMKNEFETIILPIIKENKQYFSDRCLEFDYYKRIVAFVMSYSFNNPDEDPEELEPDEAFIGPMMVPVADILNHIAKNNAQLQFEENELIISSTKPIKCGEEVFNTYGEHSNTDLLHMYGFVEEFPENVYDSVEITTKCFEECYKKYNNFAEDLMVKKIETLKELDIIDDELCFLIGTDGILNEEECLHMLQIYSMNKDEFIEFVDNDHELLEDEEWDNYSLLNDKINLLPIEWKHFLNECCEAHLNKLQSELETLEDRINSTRVKKVRTLITGHIQILKEFIKSLKI